MANALVRALRKRMTPQEVKLWSHLRTLRHSHGYRFRRQVPLRGFIVDFACFRPKVIIELDGGQHGEPEHIERDRARDVLLRRFGFSVLRFWNLDVDREFDGVWCEISEALLNAKLRDEPFLALDGRGGREADGVGGGAVD